MPTATGSDPPRIDVDAALRARLDRAALWSWPPRELAHLHGWILRATRDDPSRRASSCVPAAFAAGADVATAIAEVGHWYSARGKPSCFQLTDASAPADLDARLARAGYALVTPSLVMMRALGSPIAPPGLDAVVDLESRLTPAAMQATVDARWGPAARAGRAALLQRIRRPCAFAVARVGGEPAAGGQGVVVDGILSIALMRMQPAFRRRGLARAVLARLLAWGAGMGADTACLQVEAANAPARALYTALGFRSAYRYWYREAASIGEPLG